MAGDRAVLLKDSHRLTCKLSGPGTQLRGSGVESTRDIRGEEVNRLASVQGRQGPGLGPLSQGMEVPPGATAP